MASGCARPEVHCVTSRQLSGPHGKLMQMPVKARGEESDTEAYPIIVRSFTLPTSMIDSNASSRYLASRLWKS
jgi:hypothetical protein